MVDFDNKVYLVTGVTGAIGGAIAKKLDSLGSTLIFTGRNTESVLNFVNNELIHNKHIVLKLDLEDLGSISNAINLLCGYGLKIDGFIHASGVGDVRPIKMTTPMFVQKIMNVNFGSFIEIVRCILTSKLNSPKTSIVGVSAIGAFQGNETKTAYCASKAAMNAAVKCMAIELADKGVRINTVAPGATQSRMMENLINLPGGDKAVDKIKERQFLGICSPDDIADSILFMLSDSSRMISGTCLIVDGGKLST